MYTQWYCCVWFQDVSEAQNHFVCGWALQQCHQIQATVVLQ